MSDIAILHQSSQFSADVFQPFLSPLILCYCSTGVGLFAPPKQAIGRMDRINFVRQGNNPRSLDCVEFHSLHSRSMAPIKTVTTVTTLENHVVDIPEVERFPVDSEEWHAVAFRFLLWENHLGKDVRLVVVHSRKLSRLLAATIECARRGKQDECQPWFYLRLVAYRYFWLSEGA